MLSIRFIVVFLFGALALAWIIPPSWIDVGRIPAIATEPQSFWSAVVSLEDVAWGNGSPYVRISMKETGVPIEFSGWSLENDHGERAEMGLGVEHYSLGKISAPSSITVASNTSVFVHFGPSPIGVSFHEHLCSSYLRGTAVVVPQMEARCPSVEKHPFWGTLDSTCKLLISSLPRCEVLSPEHLGEMSSVCNTFLRTVPTYTACMKEVGPDAFLPQWRVFLGNRPSFINEEGGIVTLRDERGMVVDTFPYETIGLQ